MSCWKTGLAACALVAAAGLGAAVAPAARAQDREPLVRAMQILGRGAQIGVTVRDLNADEAAKGNGVIVDDVRQGSAAEKGGIKAADRIVEFDGERVRSVAQFRRLVQETAAGRGVSAIVQRDGQRVTLTVTPDRGSPGIYVGDNLLPTPPTPPAAPAPMPAPAIPRIFDRDFGQFLFESGSGRLGASVENLGDQLRGYFGVKSGVLVRSVRDGSPAAAAGLKAGDVITAMNGRAVDEPSDVSSEVRRLDRGGDFTVEVSRDRKTMTLKGKIEAREDRVRTRTDV